MKRGNDELLPVIEGLELPKDVCVGIFRCIGDQRLLPMKAVSKKWNEWIVSDGLIKLTLGSEGFMKKMKNIREYKSLSSARILSSDFTQLLFLKRGTEALSRLKNVYLQQKKEEMFYFKGMREMTNLVSLRVQSAFQDIPGDILSNLPSLRDLVVIVYKGRNYEWLSQMTRIKTLGLTYVKNDSRVSPNEVNPIENAIVGLTQLEVLSLTNPVSTLDFAKSMIFLERFSIDVDSLENYQYDYTPISELVNLKQLVITSSPTLSKMELFQNMTNLECLVFPGIPTDLVTMREKFPKLNHLKLELTYSFIEKNMKLFTEFIQNNHNKVRSGFHILQELIPLNTIVTENYKHLLSLIIPKEDTCHNCELCQGYQDYYHFYLSPEMREIL